MCFRNTGCFRKCFREIVCHLGLFVWVLSESWRHSRALLLTMQLKQECTWSLTGEHIFPRGWQRLTRPALHTVWCYSLFVCWYCYFTCVNLEEILTRWQQTLAVKKAFWPYWYHWRVTNRSCWAGVSCLGLFMSFPGTTNLEQRLGMSDRTESSQTAL